MPHPANFISYLNWCKDYTEPDVNLNYLHLKKIILWIFLNKHLYVTIAMSFRKFWKVEFSVKVQLCLVPETCQTWWMLLPGGREQCKRHSCAFMLSAIQPGLWTEAAPGSHQWRPGRFPVLTKRCWEGTWFSPRTCVRSWPSVEHRLCGHERTFSKSHSSCVLSNVINTNADLAGRVTALLKAISSSEWHPQSIPSMEIAQCLQALAWDFWSQLHSVGTHRCQIVALGIAKWQESQSADQPKVAIFWVFSTSQGCTHRSNIKEMLCLLRNELHFNKFKRWYRLTYVKLAVAKTGTEPPPSPYPR